MTNPYQAPTADAPSVASDVESLALPGVVGQVQVERAVLGGGRVLVGGQPAPKRGLTRYELPGVDGAVVEVKLRDSLRGFEIEVGGKRYPVGPRIPVGLGVLAILPIGMVAVGGAIGGALGAMGMLLNRKIATSERSVGIRAALMLGVCVGTVTLTLLVGGMFRALLAG